MTKEHIPVLAGELIDIVDPRPGETAVDCTVGGGGHARLLAGRLGPSGTLIGIDRDPTAEERFADLAAEAPCQTRFIRGDFAGALGLLEEEQVRPDIVYMDLGMSSMQIDTWARGFSYAYDAPLDMRMDPSTAADRRARSSTPGRSAGWPSCCASFGEERYASSRSCASIARGTRRDVELTSTQQLVDDHHRRPIPVPAQLRRRPSRQANLPGAADRGQRRARPARATRCRRRGSCSRPDGRLAAISFHSLEDRIVKHFLTDRARGCICPPDLPVCACGREPEAELLTRRAIAPSPGEVATNPRSRSAHLRAARKLEVS